MKCWLKCASFHPWKCIWNAVCKISAILLWCQRVYEGTMNSKLDLSPVMHRAINSSNADFLPIILSGMYFDKMFVEVHKFVFTKKKCIRNAACKMSAILLWCQSVNEGSINSKIRLVEIMAWCQHGVIPVLKSVLTKISDTIGGHRLQWPHVSWLARVQVMACHLLGTKPLTHPMLTFVINTLGNTSWCCVVLNSNVLMRENKIETTVYKLSIILFRSQ